MYIPPRIFLLGMVDVRMEVSFQRPIAAGGVRIEPAARVNGEVGCFLHCADGEIPDGLHHDGTLAADPRDDRGPIFVEMTPAGLALLPATTRPTSQGLFATLLGLAFAPSGVIEFVGLDSAGALAIRLIGQRHISEPPTPAVARPDVDPQLSGNAPGRTRQAQQEGRENPV
jgi:hypothetical protein